jgi:transcriptional regulator with AAA-type ATPase domain
MNLHAAWLGSWKAPWDLGRGRRWGDSAWSLAALSQAWLLGGAEGRWPVAEWQARKPAGPHLPQTPELFEPRPRPEWIARLRHGSPATDPARRGKHEDELAAWCWDALRDGDGRPWMAAGSVLLDRATRLRWIPLLGAVDDSGALRLPPFLELLIPEPLRRLPQGWWKLLLSSLDRSGRLLPQGLPPLALPWDDLRPFLEALLLPGLPAPLEPFRGEPWLQPIEGLGWMIDPAVRAWGRGWGAAPEALESLRPSALAWGDPPNSAVHLDLLKGRLPDLENLPEGWESAMAADLADHRPPEPPPPWGDPTLDRLRYRWGGDFPQAEEGYPSPGEQAHPCGDPFHWMAEGERAFRGHDPDGALRAFTWAFAHFRRLGSPFWAKRAAANAANSAILAADLRGLPWWIHAQGIQPSPFREQDEAILALVRGDREEALDIFRRLTRSHPDWPLPWMGIGQRGLAQGRRDWVEEALPHLPPSDLRSVLEASLGPMEDPPPAGMDPEHALIWEHLRFLRRPADARAFWAAWLACPNRLLRLEEGLAVLESAPAQRSPERLMALQALADRAESAHHSARLKALWPASDLGPSVDALSLVRGWLATRPTPTCLHCGHPPIELLSPDPPPAALCSRLREAGALGPLEVEGQLWWGFPLLWERAAVGAALVVVDRDQPLQAPVELQLLAPWIAKLAPPPPALPVPESGELLTNGTEPMSTLLRDLSRVAASELPVLLLGPTGSGKELCAREIHRRSGRSGPFVAVNCAAFAEGVLESELFGHVRGAFTGADRDRKGAIESAQGGTLLLDEVADLSPRLQSLFLRVLQEHEIRRVGSERSHQVDVRIVAATHKALESLVASGAFRQDLWYRLQGAILRVPSLRERRHEFPYLVPRLVAQRARAMKREAPELLPGLPEALARLPWPGNMREFIHALERALLRCGEGPLGTLHFPELAIPVLAEKTWVEANHAFQRRLITETLRQHGFKAAESARALGLARPAFYAALRRLGVDLAAGREAWEQEPR